MLTTTLLSLFERDINQIINELNQYQDEANIWKIEANITNSAGNLTLHLIGNLNTYIGKEIGHTNYVRNRTLEFTQKKIPKQELILQLEKTKEVIKLALSNLTAEELNNEKPILFLDKETTHQYLLIHLTMHLAYHLGQINYHRRLLDKSNI
jgi:hypothetical protein